MKIHSVLNILNFLLVILLGLTGHAEYFENSKQRGELGRDEFGAHIPNAKHEAEAHAMVELIFDRKSGERLCSGFFVRNSHGKALIATASHCGGESFTKVCSENKIEILTQSGNYYGECEKITAQVLALDMIIFEAKIEKWDFIKNDIQFLRLSRQKPRLNTHLKVLGYPSDTRRRGALTITDNCWVNDYPMLMLADLTEPERLSYLESKTKKQNESKLTYKKMSAAFMNCTVYGGNSGGPVLVENTDIVLGMPTRYWSTVSRSLSSQLSTSMNATADFIEAAQPQLLAAGIVFAEPYEDGAYIPPYYKKTTTDGKNTCHRTSAAKDSAAVDDVYCDF